MLYDAYVKAHIDLVTSIQVQQQTACSSSALIDNELGHLQAKACTTSRLTVYHEQADCVSRLKISLHCNYHQIEQRQRCGLVELIANLSITYPDL